MPDTATRKTTRSPRAPSISLDEAIDKAARIYARERRHPAPVEAVAKNLGYSGARNGAAIQALASLRYYGLVERPNEGQVQVSKDFESYNFAPDDKLRHELRAKWLRAPTIFSELLDKFERGLPSDATLKYTLIQRGFAPTTADECLTVFRKSVEFARYYDGTAVEEPEPDVSPSAETPSSTGQSVSAPMPAQETRGFDATTMGAADRIPIRLSGGRRAWLEIPSPFFESDKDRLKAQIDLLITDDEGSTSTDV